MTALVSRDNVRAYARIAGANTTDDALLDRLIAAVSTAAETFCARTFAVTSYTDAFRPMGQSSIFLKHGPVVTFTGLTVAGIDSPSTNWTRDGRVLTLNSGVFGAGPVVATYTAGYATVPDDVQQAVIETVVLRYREMDRLGLSSKGLAGETTAFIVSELTQSAKAILQRHREVAL
jgi:hypothetical protein